MFAIPEVDTLPLKMDDDGVIRVAGTRVSLDIVITAFNEEGASAEEITHQFPVLSLADVYSVIGYYLRNRDSVDEYLHERATRREQVRRENEARFSTAGLRERLLARRKLEQE